MLCANSFKIPKCKQITEAIKREKSAREIQFLCNLRSSFLISQLIRNVKVSALYLEIARLSRSN